MLLATVPLVVVLMGVLYMLGMEHLEGRPRGFGRSVAWAAETVTTVGYGADNAWSHPVMIGFIAITQFTGVIMIFLVVPVFLLPFIEERFEGRLPKVLPKLTGHVVIYQYGPAVSTLMRELEDAKVPVVVFEEREATARRLLDRRVRVVFGSIEEDEPDLSTLKQARALVLNGEDHNNASFALAARECGFAGTIVALVENPYRRTPMMLSGATAAFTPEHVLAAAVAAKASAKINPRVAGAQQLGTHLDITELRIHRDSSLAGKTLTESKIRELTGATIVGQWVDGELDAQPDPETPLVPGTILLAAGSSDSLRRLGEITRPITRDGPLIVAGYGRVGEKVAQFLRDAGEPVCVIDSVDKPGVDVAGDAIDRRVLENAGIGEARAVILALENDSATLFAATVIRDLAPELAIIASVNRAANVGRIHRAGADFSLSVGQVAGQLLVHHVLGEHAISLQSRIKIVKVQPGELEGENPIEARVRERTDCSIIAVQRGEDVVVELDGEFTIDAADTIYVCGTSEAVSQYFAVFPGARG